MNRVQKRWKGALAWILAFLMVCSIITPVAIPRKAKAAEGNSHTVKIGKTTLENGDRYVMEKKEVTVSLDVDVTGHDDKVEWITDSKTIKMSKVGEQTGANMIKGTKVIALTASSFGDSSVVVSGTDKDGNDFTIAFTVHVGFSMDFGTNFQILDNKHVVVLQAGGDIINIGLIYNPASGMDVRWSTSNQDIFKVSCGADEPGATAIGNSVKVTSTGAGKAELTVACDDPSIETSERSQTVTVYVMPTVKRSDTATWIKNNDSPKPTWDMKSGDSFYVNTLFGTDAGVYANQKVAWAVMKQPDSSIGSSVQNNYEFLADSFGSAPKNGVFSNEEIKAFSLGPTGSNSNEYKIKGLAGQYQLFIFLAGTYEKDENVQNLKPGVAKKYEDIGLKGIVINVNISANSYMQKSKNIDISMIAGDSLNLASYFNVSHYYLINLFTPAIDIPNLVDLSPDDYIAMVKPNAEGSVVITLTGNSSLASSGANEITTWSEISNDISPGDTLTITIHISSKFELNITEATVYKGSTINLQTKLTPLDVGATYVWSSSSPSDASVTANGSNGNTATVKALKSTKSVTITVTCTLENGVQRKATCTLRILDAVSSIKFNHDEMEVEAKGDPKLLKVELGESQSGSMNLLWRSSDETIATVEPSGNSESAFIYGKKVGTAIVWVENADNFVYATCKVRVYSGVTSIEFVDVKDPVKVNKAQKYLQLNLKVTLSDGTVIGLPELSEYNVDLDWKVGNQSVLDVTNETGLIALKSSGTSRVAVTAAKTNPLVAAYVDITVTEQTSGLAINPSSATVEQGSTVTLNYVLSPSDSGAQLTWSSLDTKIATVTQKGVVSGIKAGQTYIILKTDDGQVATALVTVTQKASGITLDVYNVTVGVGDSYTVTAKPNPSTSTETSFTWTSKDPTIATVKDGVVTGVKAGQTIVLVKSSRGAVEYLYVTVQQDVLGMTLNYNKKEIAKGKTFTLKAVFNPEKVTNTNVKWSSSDEKIATVNTSGKVKGIKGGTAVITAVSEDGGYLDYCIVEVTQLSTGIKLNYSSKKIPLKGKVTLKATISGNTSKNQTLKWSSNNTSIATVSNKGVVTAKSKVGTCVITCKTTDGSGEKATCTIRVYRKITSLSLNKSTIKIREGKTYRITAKVKPSNATYKSVTWSTSDPDIATIDSKGYITAVKAGSCKVYATAKDGTKKKASCWVYVLENVPSTAVTLESSNMVMVRGTKSVINYTLSPANSTDTVTFSSNNKAVATVSSTGNVTAKKVGTATITIRSSSGKRALLTVTVIGLNKTSLYMEQYDTENLWIEGASNVVWDSTNPSVATVSGGRVTARKPGTATIIASVNGVKMYCNVTVVPIKQ